mmetsp:Transcript_24084/g.60666  ORF Transcript_24084/g.60666 Transcript_24084/m.60666 type:complete len:236 (-) Transcript_24084:201-908(-)
MGGGEDGGGAAADAARPRAAARPLVAADPVPTETLTLSSSFSSAFSPSFAPPSVLSASSNSSNTFLSERPPGEEIRESNSSLRRVRSIPAGEKSYSFRCGFGAEPPLPPTPPSEPLSRPFEASRAFTATSSLAGFTGTQYTIQFGLSRRNRTPFFTNCSCRNLGCFDRVSNSNREKPTMVVTSSGLGRIRDRKPGGMSASSADFFFLPPLLVPPPAALVPAPSVPSSLAPLWCFT